MASRFRTLEVTEVLPLGGLRQPRMLNQEMMSKKLETARRVEAEQEIRGLAFQDPLSRLANGHQVD
ncbi:MAG TPA: hypothetical protein VN682_15570 [Terriglobales bacterium]|nr:hypothetical protein [Terriglobales bacterium]